MKSLLFLDKKLDNLHFRWLKITSPRLKFGDSVQSRKWYNFNLNNQLLRSTILSKTLTLTDQSIRTTLSAKRPSIFSSLENDLDLVLNFIHFLKIFLGTTLNIFISIKWVFQKLFNHLPIRCSKIERNFTKFLRLENSKGLKTWL